MDLAVQIAGAPEARTSAALLSLPVLFQDSSGKSLPCTLTIYPVDFDLINAQDLLPA